MDNVFIRNRIIELLDNRKWTVNKLGTMMKKNPNSIYAIVREDSTVYPDIITLVEICDAFGITLSEFFSGEDVEVISKEERDLIKRIRKFPKDRYNRLLGYVEGLESIEK